MRIVDVEPFIVHIPLKDAISDSTNSITHWGFPGVILHADSGLRGFGFTGTHAFLAGDQAIANYIRAVYAPLLLGEELEGRACIERLWKKLHDTPPLRWIGRAGLSHLALAAVDIALWDLFAKSLDRPLWSILSTKTAQTRVDAYNTNAGWLSVPSEKLVAGCLSSIEQGFKGVKIKVGNEDPRVDLARIEAVRKAIGSESRLMIDVNGRWSLETAIELSGQLDAFDLFWCEEPLYFDDLTSHAALSGIMRTPLALGEQLYTRFHFDAFIQAKAVTHVQVDAVRVAGITEWLAVADMSLAHGLSVVPHVGDMMQVHQHMAFAHPACSLLEFIPWARDFFEEPATIRDGCFVLPQSPGAGTTFKHSVMSRFGRSLG